MRVSLLVLILGMQTALLSPWSWALPTRQEAYRNDELGVVVYRDSSDAEVFWYLPILKPLVTNGHVNFRKRVRSNGNTDYTFYLLPQFPADIAQFVANEIPGLHNRNQLKPVLAKRFGLQIREFKLSALSDEVTDYRYLNSPQMIRLSLGADDAADFDDLFSSSPGVPVNMAIYYESERVEKYLQIELSYREVFDAMKIGATGRYTFTKAEIAVQVSEYLGNKYLTIKSKGDIKIPEIVEKVIQQCFTPAHATQVPRNGFMLDLFNSPSGLSASSAEALRRNAAEEFRLRERGGLELVPTGGFNPGGNPLPSSGVVPTSVPPVPGSGAGAGASAGASSAPSNKPIDASLEFTFKKELSDRNERFLFMQEQMADTQEITVIPTYLTEQPFQTQPRLVTLLESKSVQVEVNHDAGHPLRSGVFVKPGDQWTINAAFSLSARSPYGQGLLSYYRWDTSWPKVEGDLYFRVGSGPWVKVNGRALVGSDVLVSGELQFYEDRATIWSKIPEDMRSASMLGVMPPIFPYKSTYPEFIIALTGKHIEGGQ